MAEAFGVRSEGARRLAAFAVVVVLNLAPGCGPDIGPTRLAVGSVMPDGTGVNVNVTVRGVGFRPGATVTFGGIRAEVLSISDSSILANVPEVPPGRVDVVVTNTDGESARLVDGFTVFGPISGTVVEFRATGERVPVANLRLKVRAGITSSGATSATPLADVVTDAQGRYTVREVPARVLFFQPDPASEYRFLCDWYPIVVSVPLTDLPVVPTTWSGSRPPPGMWFIRWTGAWGTVSEQIDGSLQPVAGATVILDGGRPDPPATTDPNGFFMICSVVGADQGRTLEASKTGYNPVWREFSDGSGVLLQLTRK
jgi:hypothetical protein